MTQTAEAEPNPKGFLNAERAKFLLALSKRMVEGADGELVVAETGKLDCIGEAMLKIATSEDPERPQSLYDVYLETAPNPYLNSERLDELAGIANDGFDAMHGTDWVEEQAALAATQPIAAAEPA